MVLNLNRERQLKNTERYQDTGLSPDFLQEMRKVIAALEAAGYEPYDQLFGYIQEDNIKYITRHGGAREIVSGMDKKHIKVFLKHFFHLL